MRGPSRGLGQCGLRPVRCSRCLALRRSPADARNVCACTDSAPDVVKADEAGRASFLELAGQLEALQEDQLKQECSTSVVRGAAAVCKFAQIGLKRSKQIAQGGNSFSVKDFIKNLQNKFPAQAQDEAGEGCIDWKKNSQVRPCGELICGVLLRWVPSVPGSGAAQQAGRARMGPLLHFR